MSLDAPEKGQAFGRRAKQAMSDLVFGRDVELVPHTIDRYGRERMAGKFDPWFACRLCNEPKITDPLDKEK